MRSMPSVDAVPAVHFDTLFILGVRPCRGLYSFSAFSAALQGAIAIALKDSVWQLNIWLPRYGFVLCKWQRGNVMVDSRHSVRNLWNVSTHFKWTSVLTTNFSVVNCGSSNQIRMLNQPLISGGIQAHGTSAVVSQPQGMIGAVLSI